MMLEGFVMIILPVESFTTRKSKNTRAFTLIELLVVISIIAIIAAILFPVFARVREKGRQTVCTSNLRQLGLAFAQYADDNDQTLPVTPPGLSGCGWGGKIYPYVKSFGVFTCPDDTTTKQLNPNTGVILQPVSYAYNDNIAILASSSEGIGGAVSKFNAPSSTVLLYEVTAALNPGAEYYTYNVADLTTTNEIGATLNAFEPPNYSPTGFGLVAGGTFSGAVYQQATGYMGGPGVATIRSLFLNTTYYTGPKGRHSNGSNFLAVDGHVKWLNGASVSTGSYFVGETTPDTIEDSFGPDLADQAAGTESSQGWTLTFSPV